MSGKKSLPFLFFFLFSLSFAKGFCASKVINSLSMDFTRTETVMNPDEQSPATNTMTGKIIYNKYPYIFVFQIISPTAQTMYQTQDKAFFMQDDTITDFSENAEFLSQICRDFLNWFKEDYGLKESFFSPLQIWTEDGKVVSRWDYMKRDEHPIDTVIVHSDSQGRLTNLSMYLDMEEKTPMTETSLFDFQTSAGCSYPTKVVSVSYEEEVPVLTTELCFSNVQFNNSDINNLTTYVSLIESDSTFVDVPSRDNSFSRGYKSPAAPAQTVYRVSIPSVLVNTSYKFYKKFITNQDMSDCPFYPSCSQFMLEAVSQNGVTGFFIGLERLKRCTNTEHKRNLYPTLSNGKHYDPVPVKQKSQKKGSAE